MKSKVKINNKHKDSKNSLLEKDFSLLEKKINIIFNNKNLLIQAFIHRSYINENSNSKLSHNERLEFLGDAVLELVCTNFLFHKYKNLSEGELTAYRSALVNMKTIGEIGDRLGFNDYLFLSKGESRDFGKARISILSDTYEALLGAIFLDKGFVEVEGFIKNTLLINTENIIKEGRHKDAKSFVQEKAQELFSFTPTYKVINESGPDHNKNFIVAIFFGDKKIAEGGGGSKQEAETNSAKEAMKKYNWK